MDVHSVKGNVGDHVNHLLVGLERQSFFGRNESQITSSKVEEAQFQIRSSVDTGRMR